MSHFEIYPEIYCFPVLGNDHKLIDLNNPNYSLAIFKFFGTLIWGETGFIYTYENIILGSPYIKDNLKIISQKGYIICILEYVPRKKLNKFISTVKTFCQTLQGEVSVQFFAYTNKEISPKLIYNSLLKYFNPKLNKFGENSFYCGNRLDKFHISPWFRNKEEDVIISKELNMKLYNPDEILGIYGNVDYKSNTLYITCGQNFSGYEIEYETFRCFKYKDGIKFRCKKEKDFDLLAINVEDIIDVEDFIIEKNESIIVFGSNPSYEERENIRNKFIDYNDDFVLWYAKFPYRKDEFFQDYQKRFQNPLTKGELFFRLS
jgi:hypothetical protein